jgi:chemotaxis protein MotB
VGLNLEIVDRTALDVADGSKVPFDRTQRLVQKLAAPLKATPLGCRCRTYCRRPHAPSAAKCKRVRSSPTMPADAAKSRARGLPPSHIFAVFGQGRHQPLFPDDPTLPANRRVTITLMREDPPLPPDMKP